MNFHAFPVIKFEFTKQLNNSFRCIVWNTKTTEKDRTDSLPHRPRRIRKEPKIQTAYNVGPQCDFKTRSFLILDISCIHTADFFATAWRKKINCRKKAQTTRSFTVGFYFWCVCNLSRNIYTVKTKHLAKNVWSSFSFYCSRITFHLRWYPHLAFRTEITESRDKICLYMEARMNFALKRKYLKLKPWKNVWSRSLLMFANLQTSWNESIKKLFPRMPPLNENTVDVIWD